MPEVTYTEDKTIQGQPPTLTVNIHLLPICYLFSFIIPVTVKWSTVESFRSEDEFTSTRFNLKSLRVFSKKNTPRKASSYFFSPKSLYSYLDWRMLSPLQIVKWWNFLHLITCSRHYDILAKTRSKMTTAITFSRQNDAGSRASNTYYWENLVLVVVIVLESKAL